MKSIYDLELFEVLEGVEDKLLWTSVLRVPGGWMFRSFDKSSRVMSAVFVPFNNEFQKVPNSVLQR